VTQKVSAVERKCFTVVWKVMIEMMSMAKNRVEELVELSKTTRKMTFKQKLKLMDETAHLLRKGRSMKKILQRAD